MTTITRKVTLDDLRALLDDPPRANVAWVEGDDVRAAPVLFRRIEGRYWIGTRSNESAALPTGGSSIVLLVDDGYLYFDLRGARITGVTARPESLPPALDRDAAWLEVLVERSTAWHYGTLRKRDLS